MKSEKDKIFVFGASGHAKVVIDIIEQRGIYEIAALIDDNALLKSTTVYDYKVLGGKVELLALRQAQGISRGVVAIGSNAARCAVSSWLVSSGFDLVTAVHPSAQLARGVRIGAGTVVMAGAVINADSLIGSNVIINTRVCIDHDCVIGDGAHIAPGVTLCGTVTVGENTFICAGATVIPNLTIGANVVVGAGATVIRDVPDNVVVVGTPARVTKRQ